ncbi:MAG: hypothetical protein HYZ28_29045 [Myxococcales bacterium]|nr:hypothetical protein [Myxococcales bacterium]
MRTGPDGRPHTWSGAGVAFHALFSPEVRTQALKDLQEKAKAKAKEVRKDAAKEASREWVKMQLGDPVGHVSLAHLSADAELWRAEQRKSLVDHVAKSFRPGGEAATRAPALSRKRGDEKAAPESLEQNLRWMLEATEKLAPKPGSEVASVADAANGAYEFASQSADQPPRTGTAAFGNPCAKP